MCTVCNSVVEPERPNQLCGIAYVARSFRMSNRSYALSDAHHRFIPDEPDWGFTRFIQLRELYSIQEGKTRPIIENDSADLTVYLRVMKDPNGDLWDTLVK
jgi:hypothetical protein